MTDPLAQAAMVAWCGWDPTEVVTDRTIKLDGTGNDLLLLPSLHVTGVSAISVTDRWGTVTVPTIGPGMDCDWSENGCLVWNSWARGNVWPYGQRNVGVTYSGGYTVDTLPAEIPSVLASITKRMPTASSGKQSKTMGSTSFTYSKTATAGELLVVEQLVLNRYRILGAR
ncbi:MAG: hypothetical protein QOH56_4351 [Pseudonocardiales bacterium]|jgi:hypothetical protein|nr:hypothetical protein [Pseudonocardiales bacterium]